MEELEAVPESSRHCVRLAIDGQALINGALNHDRLDLVLSPAGAVALIRSVRTALEEIPGLRSDRRPSIPINNHPLRNYGL